MISGDLSEIGRVPSSGRTNKGALVGKDGRKEVWLPLEDLVVLVCGIALGRTSLDTLINLIEKCLHTKADVSLRKVIY